MPLGFPSSGSQHVTDAAAETLAEPRLERAIGVIYRPESELQSHYFEAHLANQFDAVIHIDRTASSRTTGTHCTLAAR